MQTAQEFIYNWAFANNHRIFVNLDKEKYWLVNTYENSNVYNFEHNSIYSVPNYDFDIIKKVMRDNGFSYYTN